MPVAGVKIVFVFVFVEIVGKDGPAKHRLHGAPDSLPFGGEEIR